MDEQTMNFAIQKRKPSLIHVILLVFLGLFFFIFNVIRSELSYRILSTTVTIREEKKKKNDGKKNVIERIYYINMADKTDRRDFMESWLNTSDQKLPYQRIEGISAKDDPCEFLSKEQKKSPLRWKWCYAVLGLRNTHLHIMDNYNTSGLSLVLEDDYQFKNVSQYEWAINEFLPHDWDIVRFDCWGYRPSSMKITKHGAIEVFRTLVSENCTDDSEREIDPDGRCWFCGGTHILVYRHTKLKRVRQNWINQSNKAKGIDCKLNYPAIKSYCINGLGNGQFKMTLKKVSTIVKPDLLKKRGEKAQTLS